MIAEYFPSPWSHPSEDLFDVDLKLGVNLLHDFFSVTFNYNKEFTHSAFCLGQILSNLKW